jgi:hypothetical protein
MLDSLAHFFCFTRRSDAFFAKKRRAERERERERESENNRE